MSAQAWESFGGEQVTVTSGLDGSPITLRNAAWCVLELRDLAIPQIVIENRASPGAVGSAELPGGENEVRASLPFQITGSHMPDGTPVGVHPRIGLRRHWVYLTQHLFRPSRDGALAATYQSIDPDEAPIDFRIQFAAPAVPGAASSEWTCTLAVVVPWGALVAEAS